VPDLAEERLPAAQQAAVELVAEQAAADDVEVVAQQEQAEEAAEAVRRLQTRTRRISSSLSIPT
jgi:hypothetical protein